MKSIFFWLITLLENHGLATTFRDRKYQSETATDLVINNINCHLHNSTIIHFATKAVAQVGANSVTKEVPISFQHSIYLTLFLFTINTVCNYM